MTVMTDTREEDWIYAPKLTVPETARALRKSEVTIRRWLRSGYLKGTQTGRTWLVLESDLKAFMGGQR